jgi:hypothetical protein
MKILSLIKIIGARCLHVALDSESYLYLPTLSHSGISRTISGLASGASIPGFFSVSRTHRGAYSWSLCAQKIHIYFKRNSD